MLNSFQRLEFSKRPVRSRCDVFFTLYDVGAIRDGFGDALHDVLGQREHRLVVVHVDQVDDQLQCE